MRVHGDVWLGVNTSDLVCIFISLLSRWEVEHGDETYTTFTDRWWSRPEEGNRWGEKKRVVHTRLRRKSEEEEMDSNSTSRVVSDKVEVGLFCLDSLLTCPVTHLYFGIHRFVDITVLEV